VTPTLGIAMCPNEPFNRRELDDVHSNDCGELPSIATCRLQLCDRYPDPTMVTLCDPVPTTFVAIIWLIIGTSYDAAATRLPNDDPTVPTADRGFTDPADTLMNTALLDVHFVASLPVPPNRPTSLYATRPAPAPTTVTDTLPVDAVLRCTNELSVGPECVSDCVILPTNALTVADDTTPPNTPLHPFTCNAVAEIQLLLAHPVPPIKPEADHDTVPALPPTTVTLTLDVLATFVTPTELIVSPSNENDDNKLPVQPTVVEHTPVPAREKLPCDHLTKSELSEVQAVLSTPLPPTRRLELIDKAPIPPPITVTDSDPVPATLVAVPELSVTPSCVKPCVMLPNAPHNVTATQTPPLEGTPLLLQCTALDDTHDVDSMPLTCCRIICVMSFLPMLVPTNVTLSAPVEPTFHRVICPTLALSYVHAALIDVKPNASVLAAVMVRHDPDAMRPTIALSEFHRVSRVSLYPSRRTTLRSQIPPFLPTIVTNTDPVVAPFPTTRLLATAPS
jgi:hypothetical protein